MTKREPLMTQEHFDKWVDYARKRIPEMEHRMSTPPNGPLTNRAAYAYSLFRESYEFVVRLYSAGSPISEMRSAFPRVIETGEQYLSLARDAYPPGEKPQRPTFAISFEEYVTALWLLSLAIAFDIDNAMFARLVKVLDKEGKGNNEGQDQLYESLVATRINNRKKADKLLYPKPYKSLYEAIGAGKSDQPRMLQDFLKHWYPSMKDAYWYDRHKKRITDGFFGYWAFEAVGVVKAFGIDDSTFRDLPYYPKDLLVSS